MSRQAFLVPVVAAFLSASRAFGQTVPELPRVFLDTTYAPPVGGSIRRVNAGGDFQAALNSAQPGDIIELEAGATFTGHFLLPNKLGTGWIYIRSTAYSSLPPPGTRVSPSQAGLMPKLVTPDATPVLRAAAAAHHYRLVGMELAGSSANLRLVSLEADGGQTTLGQVPTDIVFDRCYIHGSPTGSVRCGIVANSARTAVVDSYLSNFHDVNTEAQAIGGWNGPGPFKIVNDYLEGAGENVMFGGGDPSIAGLVPSDIEIRGNHFFKPLTWRIGDPSYAGTPWVVKNLLELKNARRVLVEGNVLEQCWQQSQNGFAVLFTVRNQDGGAPWSSVQDVTFRRNIVRHAASGINTHATDNNYPSQQTQRILIRDNLFEDIDAARWGGVGRLYQFYDYPSISTGIRDMTVEHNTGFSSHASAVAGYNANRLHTGVTFRNNIAPKRVYGFAGADSLPSVLGVPNIADGDPTLGTFFVSPLFVGNVLTGSAPSSYSQHPGNFFPATDANVGFVNLAGGDYRLAASSPYKGAATDGRDPGADIDSIASATAGAVSGVSTNPKEASPAGGMTLKRSAGSTLTVAYTAACGSSGHVIYWGSSPIAGAVAWTNAACEIGTSGSATFDPGNPSLGRFFYFVIVGQNFEKEGSYGRDSHGAERPEAIGIGACNQPQSLSGACP